MNCKQERWESWSTVRCARRAVRDGYCAQHHPDAVKKRDEKTAARLAEVAARCAAEEARRAQHAANAKALDEAMAALGSAPSDRQLRERISVAIAAYDAYKASRDAAGGT